MLVQRAWQVYLMSMVRRQLASGIQPNDARFDLNLLHIKDPVCTFIAAAWKLIAANPKVVEDAWTQSGLAKMLHKNTQIAAVEINARGELFKVDNPQLEEEEGLEDAEDEEDCL